MIYHIIRFLVSYVLSFRRFVVIHLSGNREKKTYENVKEKGREYR
jgi:hypothetical protein